MQTKLGAPGHMTKFYRPKVGRKWTILNRYILVITDIDKNWFMIFKQAWRQDSVTGGGAEINLGGAREVYVLEFDGATGAREVYSNVDQIKNVKTKKKVFVSNFLRFSRILKWRPKKNVFVPKVLWNPGWVHKNYEKTVLAREF